MTRTGLLMGLGVAALCSTTAMAQDKLFTETTLDYSNFTSDGDELTQTTFAFLGAYDFGAFDLRGGFSQTKLDFGEGEQDVTTVSLNAGYGFSQAFSANLAIASIGFDGGDDSTATELSVTYDGGPFWVSAFVGQTDEAFFFVVADNYYGLAGGYDFGQGTEVALAYYTGDDDTSEDIVTLSVLHTAEMLEIAADVITSDGVTYLFVDGSYEVAPDVSILAGYGLADFDGDDVSGITVGAAWEFSPGLELYGSFGRYDFFGDEADEISIGLTYKTGQRSLRDEGSYERIIEPLFGPGSLLAIVD